MAGLSRWTGEGRRLLQVMALAGVAVTQPVLDVFGRSTETFVFRGVGRAEMVAFALLVAVVPSVALWAIGVVTRILGPRVRELVHLATLGGLAAVAVVVALALAEGWRGGAAAAAAIGVGAAVAVLVHRSRAFGRFVAWLALLPAVAVASFLFVSPASSIVTGDADVELEDVAAETPLVMLVLDEFPTAVLLDGRGGIDERRFPHFARLAEESRWYRNFTTVSANTIRAIPAILTGRDPKAGNPPVLANHPDNLFTLLGGSYRMRVTETVSKLCPDSACADTGPLTRRVAQGPAGLDGLVDDAVSVFDQLTTINGRPEVAIDAFTEELVTIPTPEADADKPGELANQPVRFRDFLDRMTLVDQPTFDFLHLLLPHGPWQVFPDGTQYASPPDDPQGQIDGIWTGPWPAEIARLRLELQTRYTDSLVGDFVRRLKRTGLWGEAVVVVVSDHGGALIPGEPGRAVSDANLHQVVWTPLFVRAPELEPGHTDTNLDTLDLLPTIAELLELGVPFDVDGTSAVGRSDRPTGGRGSGRKEYHRFTNSFQPEPTAVIDIDGPAELDRLLSLPGPTQAEAADPIRAFYAATPVGDLIGKELPAAANRGPPVPGVELQVIDLAALTDGPAPDAPRPAYISGLPKQGRLADGDWVVIALDGRVEAVSPLFRDIDSDQRFGGVVRAGAVADASRVELFVTSGHDQPLRPVAISG